MLAAALLLIVVAAAMLSVGVVADALLLVQASIGVCLLAAVLLAVGVARKRPRRRPDGPPAPTWSGAAQGADDAPGRPEGER